MGLRKDNSGLAPVIWVIVLAGIAIAGLGTYQITQRPDITYNISDTGFSLAGLDVSWFMVLAIAGVVVFVIFMMFRKPAPKYPYYPPIRRS